MVSNDDRTLGLTIPRRQQPRQMLLAFYIHSPSYQRSTGIVERPSHDEIGIESLHGQLQCCSKFASQLT